MSKLFKSIFLVSFLLFFCFTFVFAEDITITTYYPSPYGSYNQLQTNRLAVGDTDGNGVLDAADQPNRDGDIRLKAQAGNPTSWPAGTTGQFAYSSANDALYHYNGSTWVAQSGSTCMVTYNSPVGSCSCPGGWTLKYDLGSWGYCGHDPTHSYFFRPPGGGCPGGWIGSAFLGEGCLCCQ